MLAGRSPSSVHVNNHAPAAARGTDRDTDDADTAAIEASGVTLKERQLPPPLPSAALPPPLPSTTPFGGSTEASRRSSAPENTAMIGGLQPPEIDGRGSARPRGAGPGSGMDVLALRPAQLEVRPDGYSLGFRLQGGASEHWVAVEHVQASHFHRKLRVSFRRSSLPPGRKGGVRASDVLDTSARSRCVGGGGCGGATSLGGAGQEHKAGRRTSAVPTLQSVPSAGVSPAETIAAPHGARDFLIKRSAKLRPKAAAPPLTRAGLSWRLCVSWGYNLAVLVVGWLGVCLMVLVALPRHVDSSGLSKSGWAAQVASAVAFGLLNSYTVLDGIKVLMLFITGPYLILRLPDGPIRTIVRQGLRPIHKPLAALF